jgi:hypothetical protein
MTYHRRPADGLDRRRRLLALSRYEETPRRLLIELTADGTDYKALGDYEEVEFAESWARLRAVLERAPDKRTCRELLAGWPADDRPPSEVTLYRWLDRLAGQGLVLREGSGRKNDPQRYWLPGQEARWRPNPLAEQEAADRAVIRQLEAEWEEQLKAQLYGRADAGAGPG